MEEPLAGVPGVGSDAGSRPVAPALLEGLLLAEGTVEAARDATRAWYEDLVGPLLVPAASTAGVQEQLARGDHGLRIVLVAEPAAGDPSGLLGLREARNLLLDDDRLELTAVHLPLPAGDVAAFLAELDFTAPAWVEIALLPGWEAALEALATDGAEHLGVRLPRDGVAPVAALVRRAVDLDLPLRVTGAGGGATTTLQLLAALGAVRAALDGAGAQEIEAALAERRMSDADAAATRQVLDGVVVPDSEQAARELAALGLVDPQD